MNTLIEALYTWGETITVNMENRQMFYASMTEQWTVVKRAEDKEPQTIYCGPSFTVALECLLGIR